MTDGKEFAFFSLLFVRSVLCISGFGKTVPEPQVQKSSNPTGGGIKRRRKKDFSILVVKAIITPQCPRIR
jgi:hypothetical protein